MNPTVSVIIPAYNASKFIKETVDSVRNQTLSDLEIIIIDDCSTDNTFNLIQEMSKEDSRIKVFKGEQNVGVAKVRNKGFFLATGKYVALLDADDIWLPEKLERQVKLAEESNADLVYCSYAMIDEHGNKICNDFLVPPKTDFEHTLIVSVISCSTALMISELCKKYSFDPKLYHEDLAFWLDILKDGYKAVGDTEITAKYRLHQSSRSSGKLNCAIQRWKIYRGHLHLSFFKSMSCLWKYATAGLKKYKKI